jgi:hypothetical protein
MKTIFLTIIVLVTSIFGFANPVVLEGTIDLNKNELSDWPYSGHYTEKFKLRVTVNFLVKDPKGLVKFGHSQYYDEGSFRHDYCWTTIQWQAGNVKAELFELNTDKPEALTPISDISKPLILSASFESPTHEWSTCYPHEYLDYHQEMTFTWDILRLPLDQSRHLEVAPFTFLRYNTLWGNGYWVKENGERILKNFSMDEGLNQTIWDSASNTNVPSLQFLYWNHYNQNHKMPLPGQADSSGHSRDFKLLQ